MITARFQQSRIRGADVYLLRKKDGRIGAFIETDGWATLEGDNLEELAREANRLGARNVQTLTHEGGAR